MQIEGKFLDTLRSRLSLAEIVGEKVKLTRKGREHIGLCPFHHEKTPSFTVSEDKEFYHCFGCGAHGDGIRFLMETSNYSFMEAVQELAGRVGLSLPKNAISQEDRQKEDLAPLIQVLQEAQQWFHKNLFLIKNGSALQYMEKRKVTRETLKKFGLGYAPEGYHVLETYLKAKGYAEDVLIKAGLLAKGEVSSQPYDRFRQRLMFPIHNTKGQIIAFGGRLLDKGEPKYLNSPETPLFSKGKELYGYFYAKAKQKTDPLIVVEGYMDVISLHQAGFQGAVAPLGTALTEDQILLAWRLSPEPILCFDGDAAGLKAAMRAAERVLSLLKPGYSLRFILLPQGEDPDSLIRKGSLFNELLPQAYSLLEVLWMFLTRGKTFKTPEQKAALQKQCTHWTQEIKNPDVRTQYYYAFKDLFYKNIAKVKEKKTSISPIKQRKLNFLLIYERLLLAILINHPNLIDEVSDDLAFLEFKESHLHEVRDALLHFYAKEAFNERSLKEYLLSEGFEDELKTFLSPHVLIHGAFAMPSASLDEARTGWREIFNRIQKAVGHNDLQDAQSQLASQMSAEAWERLKTLKKKHIA